jgi:hypothetical protein
VLQARPHLRLRNRARPGFGPVALAAALFLSFVAPVFGRADNHEQLALFKKAQHHFAHRDFEAALREFQQLYATSPRPLLLFDMGLAANELGERDEALSYLHTFVVTVDEPNADTREAKEMIAELQRHGAKLKPLPVEPTVRPPLATTTTTPPPATATAPPSVVIATAPPPPEPVVAAPLATASVPLVVARAPEPTPRSRHRGRTAGIVVGSIVLVGGAVAVGIVFGLKSSPAATFGTGQLR